MKCPFCSHADSKVVDSRPIEEGSLIRRRRECTKCHKRFTTYERVESIPLIIVKKSGQRMAFDKNKIRKGIMRACEKRPVPQDIIEKEVDSLERELYQRENKEIDSSYIGECVMNILKGIDEVAYVRFASVYRQFKDLDSFVAEVESIKSKNRG